MALRYEERPAFSIVGMKYVGKNEHGEVGRMWGDFIPRMGEIPGARERQVAYGYCTMDEECKDGAFAYVAGIESSGPAPHGMVQVEVPASKYAVYTHIGPATTLPQAFERAYAELTEAGQPHGDWAFELYPEDYDNSQTSVTEIWMSLGA